MEELLPPLTGGGLMLGLGAPGPQAAWIAEGPPMTETPTLRMQRTYDAPAQAVFDAWTSEEVMRRWWHAATTGRPRRPPSTCAWAAPCGW